MTKTKKISKGKGMVDLRNRTGYFRHWYSCGLWCFIPEHLIDKYDEQYRVIADYYNDFSKEFEKLCKAFDKSFLKYRLSRSIMSYKVFLIDKGN